MERLDYERYGIVTVGNAESGTDGVFIFTDAELQRRIDEECKVDAYALPVQTPIINGRPTANYGAWEPSYSDHTGVDFGPRPAMDVVASFSGTMEAPVKNVGYVAGLSYGNMANFSTVINDTTYRIMNCHLADGDDSIVVKEGEFVLAEKFLGIKGNTGTLLLDGNNRRTRRMNIHLHYEVRCAGAHVDPNFTFLPSNVFQRMPICRFAWLVL